MGSKFNPDIDIRFDMVLNRDTAEWLAYVLDHYVVPERCVFHYQIDRIQAIRLRRTLVEFLDVVPRETCEGVDRGTPQE